MYRKEFKDKILDILEDHYYGRNFMQDRASEDVLDLFQDMWMHKETNIKKPTR